MRIVVLAIVLLAGCRGVPMLPGLTPHKIDIQQGNYVTQDMLAKLKPGMSRSQVRFALGTPLIADPFHPERWDYVYVLQKKGKVQEHRRIVVVFQDDKLTRIEGDVTPPREDVGQVSPTPATERGKDAPTRAAESGAIPPGTAPPAQ